MASKHGARIALAATATLAALTGVGAASASADQYSTYGDIAILQSAPAFRLNPSSLEPGCFMPGHNDYHNGVPIDAHIDVTQRVGNVQISVDRDTNFSIDQVLVPGHRSGYVVYNTFDTGTSNTDADIDPGQTATDMTAPGRDPIAAGDIIVCINDHPDTTQNEPYISDGKPGEVAAINRPIIQPTVSALGVSAVNALNTYKVGFGYTVQRGYDWTWRNLFLTDFAPGPWRSLGDPQAYDSNGDGVRDSVVIQARPQQGGVARYNDFDEAGEAYSSGAEKSSYGQPILFDVSHGGDPAAYLHKSLPGSLDGGYAPWDTMQEDMADQTSALGVLTFTAEGDLPLSWSVKPSLAPEAYGKSVSLTDDMLRAWNKSWQNYYAGKGPKPTMPLAPGTNSPKPDPSITVIVNPPDTRPTTAPQAATAAPVTNITTINQTVKPPTTTVKTKVQSARLIKMGHGRRAVQVKVRSAKSSVRITVHMYNAHGHKVAMSQKTVATNKWTLVPGVHVAKSVTSVRATVG